MEIVLSILTGALVSIVLGALLTYLDRGTFWNAAIGATSGGLWGSLMFVEPLKSIAFYANANEVYLLFLILGASGGWLASAIVGRTRLRNET